MLDPHELRARIPHDVFELPRVRTLGKALFLIALVLGLAGAATVSDSLLVKIVLGFVAGVPLFTLAAVGHESGHRSASRSEFLNDLCGTLSMSILGIPARGWKLKHDIHHRNTGVLGVDSDAQVPVSGYLALSTVGRLAVRIINHYEWAFWPLTPFLLWTTTWSHGLRILTEGRRENPRTWWWNLSDLVIASAFFGALGIYTVVFGFTNLALCVALPFGVAGVVGAATFVTNHRNLPPLDVEQSRRVAKYSYVNTRSVLFPAAVPGNYFMNYVPWQIEHHIYPTIPGYKLDRVTPHLQAFGREKGATLHYEPFFKNIFEVASSRFAWGADGKLYRFTELEQMIAEGRTEGYFPGRDGETTPKPGNSRPDMRRRREFLDALLMR